jgi:2-oxoglutarate ferredoxin oxidoreductase subunit delta
MTLSTKKRFFVKGIEYILRQDCRLMKLAIDENRCKGCNLCTKVCPYKIFKEGKKLNRKGVAVPELDRPERCANCRLRNLYGRQLCGVCQLTCPDQAIHWIEEEPYKPHKVAIEY